MRTDKLVQILGQKALKNRQETYKKLYARDNHRTIRLLGHLSLLPGNYLIKDLVSFFDKTLLLGIPTGSLIMLKPAHVTIKKRTPLAFQSACDYRKFVSYILREELTGFNPFPV